jgi:hypothetical protein
MEDENELTNLMDKIHSIAFVSIDASLNDLTCMKPTPEKEMNFNDITILPW